MITTPISMFVCALIVWSSARITYQRALLNEQTDLLKIPTIPFRFIWVLGLLIFFLILCIDFVKTISEVRKKMSPIIVGIIGFIILFVLLAFGLPIGFGMAFVGFLGFSYLVSPLAALAKMGFIPFETVSSYDMAVLPLFLLMAQVTFLSGLSKDLYNLASKCSATIRADWPWQPQAHVQAFQLSVRPAWHRLPQWR